LDPPVVYNALQMQDMGEFRGSLVKSTLAGLALSLLTRA
jgi:hypothetical protein